MRSGILLAILLMTEANALAGWETISPLPVANGGFACGAIGKNVVILGGTHWKDDTKQWLDVIWVFDPASGEWQSHGQLPHPLAYAVTGEWNGSLIIAAGTDGVQPRKEVWRLPRSFKPTLVGELKQGCALGQGTVLKDSLFVVGGCADPAKLDGLRRSGERFQLREGESAPMTLPGQTAFGLGASAALGEELFIFGGARHDSITAVVNLADCWAFDSGKPRWRKLRAYPFAVRGAAAVALDEQHILIAGGYGGEPAKFTASAFVYDTGRDSYAATTDLPLAALCGLVRAGDSVYCLGGEDKMRHRTNACFRIKVAELLNAAKAKP